MFKFELGQTVRAPILNRVNPNAVITGRRLYETRSGSFKSYTIYHSKSDDWTDCDEEYLLRFNRD